MGRHDPALKDRARALRLSGLSYAEIARTLEVPKGTVGSWVRHLELPEGVREEIRRRTHPPGMARDTQWRRREEIARIRSFAASESSRWDDSEWVAGLLLYWAEGDKTSNAVGMSNADAALLRFFVRWCRTYLDPEARFALKLNLHADNDEPSARRWWRDELALPDVAFHKTFVKPDGTGHRKNTLPYGVCQVRMRRSTDAFHRVMGWIEGVRQLPHFAYRG